MHKSDNHCNAASKHRRGWQGPVFASALLIGPCPMDELSLQREGREEDADVASLTRRCPIKPPFPCLESSRDVASSLEKEMTAISPPREHITQHSAEEALGKSSLLSKNNNFAHPFRLFWPGYAFMKHMYVHMILNLSTRGSPCSVFNSFHFIFIFVILLLRKMLKTQIPSSLVSVFKTVTSACADISLCGL